jgi:hypothetical protein
MPPEKQSQNTRKGFITIFAEMPALIIPLGAICVVIGAVADGGLLPFISQGWRHFLEFLGAALIIFSLFRLFKKG